MAEHTEKYEVFVKSQRFKFNASHFIAYNGFRERIHGHNYTCSAKITGKSYGADGYLMDFGEIKQCVTKLCKSLNEHFICPMKSDSLDITVTDTEVKITCEDGSKFLFPKGDCVLLPIVHSSAEELATYLWHRVVEEITFERLQERQIYSLTFSVAEAPAQEALFTKAITKETCKRKAEDAVEPRNHRNVRGCSEKLMD